MFVLEYLHTKYPKMPTKMLQDAVSTYTKSSTLALMAKEFGVEDVARWIRSKVLCQFFLRRRLSPLQDSHIRN
jgi:large subunit ribosomal protein L44